MIAHRIRARARKGVSRWIAAATAIALVAMLPGAALAASPIKAATTHTISGYVYDYASFESPSPVAVAGVTVWLHDLGDDTTTPTTTDGTGRWYFVVADGEYEIEYDPSAVNTGSGRHLLGGWYTGWGPTPGQSRDAGTIFVEGEDVAHQDTYLDTGGTMRGTVTGGGSPLAGANVEAWDLHDDSEPVAVTSTDLSGDFTLTVPEGPYQVRFDPSGSGPSDYLPRWWNLSRDRQHSTAVTVVRNAFTGSMNQALPLGAAITGHVFKPGGSLPAQGVFVEAWEDPTNEQVATAFTAADGSYTLKPLESGGVAVLFDPNIGLPDYDETGSFNDVNGTSFVLQAYNNARVDQPTTITVAAGSLTTNINDTLNNGGTITGRVADASDTSLVDMQVQASGPAVGASTTSIAGGQFTLSNLPLGSYDVFASPETYNDANNTDFVRTFYDEGPVQLASPSTVALPSPLVMEYGARLSGKVTNSSLVGISDIDVGVLTADGNDMPASTKSGAGGTYVVHGVPAGRVKVEFNAYEYNEAHSTGYVSEYYNAKTTFRTADVLNVVPVDGDTSSPVGKYTGLDGKLVTGARIGGTITDPDGAALDGAYVQLQDVYGNLVDSGYADLGSYQFTAVPPGIYRLSATYWADDGSGMLPERWYAAKRWFSEANNIVVGAAQVVSSANIQLLEGGSMTGRVVRQGTTTGLGGVQVLIRDATGNVQQWAQTEPDGTWQTEDGYTLAPGSYYVEFDPSELNEDSGTHYGLAWYRNVAGSSSPDSAGSTMLTVGYGTALTGVNGVLSETNRGSITGTAVRRGLGGNPTETGTDLWAQAWEKVGGTWRVVAGSPVDTATGSFSIAGLQGGQPYKVSIQDADRDGSWGTFATQFFVSAGASGQSLSWPQLATTITPVPDVAYALGQFAVQKSGLFVVKTQDEGGEPLENVDVFMDYHAPDGSWWPVDGGYMGYTMASGELDLPSEQFYDVGLMPGQYRFRFERYGYDTAWYQDATSSAGATPVDLTTLDREVWDPTWVEQALTPASLVDLQIAGADRYQVAFDLAKQAFKDFKGTTNVVIASGLDKSAADPLSAAGLAGTYNAPILLVRQDWPGRLPGPTAAALAAISNANPSSKIKVWIVGGPASVPESLKTSITKALGGAGRVAGYTRFGGLDRYAVASGVANHVQAQTGSKTCFITNGGSASYFWDALAVSPVSFARHYPVLLVKGGYIPPVTKASSAKFPNRYVIGNTAHVPETVRVTLAADRITGSSRADVAARFSETAWDRGWINIDKVAIGNKLADSLVGGAAIGAMGGSMLYTGDGATLASTLDARSKQFFVNYSEYVEDVYILGGPASINKDAVMAQVKTALGK